MKKRKIIFKKIIKNLWTDFKNILNETKEILKAPFIAILDKLEELSK